MPSRDALPERVMRGLWEAMSGIYGHRWTSAYGPDAVQGAGRSWALGLAGLGPQQLRTGVDACRTGQGPDDGWPPTLPEFRALCLAIPSFAEVEREICRGAREERSGFARQVWSMLDSHRFSRAEQAVAERMLRDAYRDARRYVLAGGDLPGPSSGAIEHEQPKPIKPAAPEVVRRHLDELARELRLSEPETDAMDADAFLDEGREAA